MLVYLFMQYYIRYATAECSVLSQIIVTSVSAGCRWKGYPSDMESGCHRWPVRDHLVAWQLTGLLTAPDCII